MKNWTATRWTVIHLAREGEESAVRSLVLKYRPVVVSYLCRRGLGQEAEDLAQEVLVRLFHEGVLARANRAEGRFRSLLLAVTRNVLGKHLERRGAKKRGGGKVGLLGDQEVATAKPDEEFDREWLANLLQQALERLAREHPTYFEAFRRSILDGTPQKDVAEALGLTPGAVRKHVHRGKRKLISYLREEIWDTSSSPGDYDAELRYLAKLL